MKVIAGRYRWKKINTTKKGLNLDFKPTKSVVREAVFNIINNYQLSGEFQIENANVLDAFCGSGAYGIEALSRGASSVHFINNNKEHLELVRHNIAMLNDDSVDAQYILADARRLRKIPCKFDLIFVDPPYRTNLYKECLDSIHDNLDLTSQHLIFVELALKQSFTAPEAFNCIAQKVYGNTKVYVLKKKF